MKLISWITNTYKDRFKRYLILGLILIGLFFFIINSIPKEELQIDSSDIHFFYNPSCPHCKKQIEFNKDLSKKYPDLKIISHDITISRENKLFRQIAKDHDIPQNKLVVPITFIGDQKIIGFDSKDTTGKLLETTIKNFLEGTKTENENNEEFVPIINIPLIGEINVLDYSLPILAILLGIIDGFNPCAMWVLVFLISILVSINERKKIWILVGSFVLASGILYFLFMTAWLQAYLFVGYQKYLTLFIGIFALYVGIVDLKTYFTTKGALVCEVGDLESKTKTRSRIEKIVLSPLTFFSIFGIIALAFIVNSVEFMCSFFIPAIFTQVLALSNLSGLEYYGYILLYDFFFMLDDLIIFGLAAFAINTKYGDKYAKYCKLIGGIILLILGIFLLFFPQLLS
tara:strand:+ start:2753 stop:3952 length:1200 start_codon:yes stop_codon:yes gene_type:complete